MSKSGNEAVRTGVRRVTLSDDDRFVCVDSYTVARGMLPAFCDRCPDEERLPSLATLNLRSVLSPDRSRGNRITRKRS